MAQEAAEELKKAAEVSGVPVEETGPTDIAAAEGPSGAEAEAEEEASTTQLAVERSAAAEASVADSQAAEGEEEEEGKCLGSMLHARSARPSCPARCVPCMSLMHCIRPVADEEEGEGGESEGQGEEGDCMSEEEERIDLFEAIDQGDLELLQVSGQRGCMREPEQCFLRRSKLVLQLHGRGVGRLRCPQHQCGQHCVQSMRGILRCDADCVHPSSNPMLQDGLDQGEDTEETNAQGLTPL